MSKKNKKQEEPWSRRFGEDENFNNRQYSRSARNSKKKEVAPLYKVILFVFLALLVIPFATYYWSEQSKKNPEPQTAQQVIERKQAASSVSESEVSSEEESSEAESSVSSESKADSSSESSSDPTSEESESTAPEVPPVVEEPESIEEESDDDDKVYANVYTIKAGDNLYRIAVNHGMTLDELKEVNGLSSDVAEIGVVLKVK